MISRVNPEKVSSSSRRLGRAKPVGGFRAAWRPLPAGFPGASQPPQLPPADLRPKNRWDDNVTYHALNVAIRKLRGFCEIGTSQAQLKHDDRTDAISRYQYLHSM